jgi:hypothetical protein
MKTHQELVERETRLTERERALADTEAQQSRRAEELALQVPQMPAPTPIFEPLAPLGDLTLVESPGRWNLPRLEQLVAEHGGEFPARVDEWRSYLYFLKDHADAQGDLPSRFDWLIEDTFRELLENVA